ncbi:hypothetical protein [Microbacterium protaetiae]|uniref:hypothetical protein n=1 Tax=Microbacterium protaetiae TaxID=2509458 RepID=UPI001A92451D|nr:hypothetical protein [Microbacterium protaetiae]
MARRTADQTRRLILDAALQLLLERGASAGVQHIRLQEVLRAVGLTSGAAYRIWADQDEFHRDLAVETMGLRFDVPTASATAAVDEALAGGGGLDDVVRAGARDHVEYAAQFHLRPQSRDAHVFVTALALRTAAGAWPELRAAAAARHEESIDAFSQFYAEMLERFGRRMRTPFTIRDLAEALAALGEGFAVRAAEGLEHPVVVVGDDDESYPGEWTLFGIAIRGLVDTFTIGDEEAAPAAGPSPADRSR